MLNCYWYILCIFMGAIFPSETLFSRFKNSEYDSNTNGLQRYYISQSAEEPEYFLDSSEITTESREEQKFIDILALNKNTGETFRSNYFNDPNLTDLLKAVGQSRKSFNRGLINIEIKPNNRPQTDIEYRRIKKTVEQLSTTSKTIINDKEIEKKIKEMDLAENPDVLVALFINILKKKYPEKLAEMKDVLDKMANTGELICEHENSDRKSIHSFGKEEKFFANRAKDEEEISRMNSTTIIATSTTISSTTELASSENTVKEEKKTARIDEGENEEDENGYEEDESSEEDADNSKENYDYNYVHDYEEKPVFIQIEENSIAETKTPKVNNKLKSIYQSIVSTLRPFIMPTIREESSLNSNFTNIFKSKTDNTKLKEESLKNTEKSYTSDEQNKITSQPLLLKTSKLRIQLKEKTEKTINPSLTSTTLAYTSTKHNYQLLPMIKEEEIENTLEDSTYTIISTTKQHPLTKSSTADNNESDIQIKNNDNAIRRKAKHRIKHKKIATHHRKKYKQNM